MAGRQWWCEGRILCLPGEGGEKIGLALAHALHNLGQVRMFSDGGIGGVVAGRARRRRSGHTQLSAGGVRRRRAEIRLMWGVESTRTSVGDVGMEGGPDGLRDALGGEECGGSDVLSPEDGGGVGGGPVEGGRVG